MKQIVWVFCCMVLTQVLHAQAWQQQSGKVSFQIDNAGITVDGYFEDAPAISLSYPNRSIRDIQLSGSVAVAGIKTGISIRDKHLLRSDYFDVANFPAISMVSQSITGSGTNVTGRFLLTMKGTTKPVDIAMHIQETAGMITIVGEFTINRQYFKIGGESLILSDEVKIKVEAVFVKV